MTKDGTGFSQPTKIILNTNGFLGKLYKR